VNELLLFAALGSPEPPPSFSALPPAPPPAVAVAPQLVRPSADPEWRDEYRPEYGGWVKVRTVPAATKGGVVPGVTTGPGKRVPPPSAGGTGALSVSTNPPTANPMAPGKSKDATPTAPTTTSVQPVAPAGSSPAGGTKFLVSERTDEQGNRWQYYSDGSVTICSAFG
jgi:hypothetical protein